MGDGVNALEYLLTRFNLPREAETMPVEIPRTVRTDLGWILRDLGFVRGAEIGVWRGEFSEALCQANPALHLTCVDAWTPYWKYSDYRLMAKLDEAEADARRRLAPFVCTIIKAFSEDAAKRVKDSSLDFVYIDSNHEFEFVVRDLAAWIPKVRQGGIIAGHDYDARYKAIHVAQAVQGYTSAYNIRPWFVLGRRKTRRGEPRDRERSFLWVKP